MANKVLEQLAAYLETKIKESLVKQKHVATGKLLNSIKVQVKDSIKTVSIIGTQSEIGKYVDRGRKPGAKGVPISALERWIKQKGIATEAKEVRGIAFAMQKRIKEKGIPSQSYEKWKAGNAIKRTGYLTDVLDKEENYIREQIQKAFKEEIDILITNLTKRYGDNN